jgi:2-haloacid dehalogenase
MVMEPVRPDVVVFDVLGTLVDLSGLDAAFENAGLPPYARELWMARVLRDGFALATCGTFAAFSDLVEHHLQQLIPDSVNATRSAKGILAALETLEPFPDVAPATERLRQHRLRAVALTNGTEALARSLLQRAGLSRHFEAIYDVSSVMLWKPRQEPYAEVAHQLRVDAERLAMLAAHPWDIHGATCAGLLGAWINRSGTAYPTVMNRPRVQGQSLNEVIDKLAALPD